MRYAKAENLLRLGLELAASYSGLSLQDIEAKFEVSHRTAQRMRDAVERVFPQLEEVPQDDRIKRWRLPIKALGPVVDVSAEHIHALEIAVDVLKRDNRNDLAQSLERLGATARASLRPRDASRIEPDLEALLHAEGLAMRPGPRSKVDFDILAAIRMGILTQHEVKILHRGRGNGKSKERVVRPYGLLYGHRHYLLAFDLSASDIRTFSLANIDKAEDTGKAFVADPAFSLNDYAERSFGVFQEEPFNVAWKFSPQAAKDASEFVFHPKQVVEAEADGSLVVRFRAGGWLEMLWHLFTWGTNVEVLEPQWMRESHQSTARDWEGRP
jgi:predicted DNA-binding transcriptional regulator YafY